MKICTKCKKIKELYEFSKRSNQKYLKSHCKLCCSGFAAKWKANNPEKYDKNVKTWFENNKTRVRLNQKLWNVKNPSQSALNKANRKAALLQRTPKWLTHNDLDKIKSIYKLSATLKKLFNTEFHVDHIIPLQGKMVSGLHVPWNLKILPATENRTKSNKLI